MKNLKNPDAQPLLDTLLLDRACALAEAFVGATAPNPPVGACVVRDGKILGEGAHERAGGDHAEIMAFKSAIANGHALTGATLYVTLEPCSHHGKTPPCTKAIIEAQISRVVYAAHDPNPKAANGALQLKQAGIDVLFCETEAAKQLIAPFKKLQLTGLPWITHKMALRKTEDGSLTMLPQSGKKTFTSEQSLDLAHLERKKSDAILVGLNTVIADEPLFTVRRIADHKNKTRKLAVITRSASKIPTAWIERQIGLGFEVLSFESIEHAIVQLGEMGVLRALIETGPTLSAMVIEKNLWDERLTFFHDPAREDIWIRETRTKEN